MIGKSERRMARLAHVVLIVFSLIGRFCPLSC